MRAALLIGTVLISVAAAVAAPAGALAARSCASVVNPYEGTRYEGVDLTPIRAQGVSCAVARGVARRAHRKALGLNPPPNGIRRFSWRGWRVRGDLRPSSDAYVARKGARVVRWRF